MRELVQILQYAGFALYALPILWSVLALMRASAASESLKTLRHFRRLGPLLGLSLGACILGTLAGIWLDHGVFELRWSTEAARVESAMYITFFAVWVSNIKLEVWTLEPLRKLDPEATQTPVFDDRYGHAVRSIQRHMTLHAVGLISVIVLRAGL